MSKIAVFIIVGENPLQISIEKHASFQLDTLAEFWICFGVSQKIPDQNGIFFLFNVQKILF